MTIKTNDASTQLCHTIITTILCKIDRQVRWRKEKECVKERKPQKEVERVKQKQVERKRDNSIGERESDTKSVRQTGKMVAILPMCSNIHYKVFSLCLSIYLSLSLSLFISVSHSQSLSLSHTASLSVYLCIISLFPQTQTHTQATTLELGVNLGQF